MLCSTGVSFTGVSSRPRQLRHTALPRAPNARRSSSSSTAHSSRTVATPTCCSHAAIFGPMPGTASTGKSARKSRSPPAGTSTMPPGFALVVASRATARVLPSPCATDSPVASRTAARSSRHKATSELSADVAVPPASACCTRSGTPVRST